MLDSSLVCDGEDANVVVATSLEDTDDIIRAFEDKTTSKFVTAKQKKSFGKELGPMQLNARILWEDVSHHKAEGYRIKYDGVPLMLVGFKVMHCRYGADRHIAAKAKYKARKECDETYPHKRRKQNSLESKKLGCPAKIRLRELLKFPKYKIYTDSKINRMESARKLKNDMCSGSNVTFERRIYIDLPADADHCYHPVGEGCLTVSETKTNTLLYMDFSINAEAGPFQTLDRSIANFIHARVDAGIETVDDMRSAVEGFVENNLFKGKARPPETNRRYHPTDQDIRNHMHLGRTKRKAQSGEIAISSLVNLVPISSTSAHTPECNFEPTGSSLPIEKELERLDSENSAADESAVADKHLTVELPLTVHLQVEPEATESMSSDCQRLLKMIQRQTRTIRDPDTLHKLHAVLQQLVAHLDSKITEEGGCQAASSGTPAVWNSLRMSGLEKELKKSNHNVKKKKRSLVPCDGPDFSDSDYEVHCETLSHDTDGYLGEEVMLNAQESMCDHEVLLSPGAEPAS